MCPVFFKFTRVSGRTTGSAQMVFRAQADALDIKAPAKRRQADEYDAAQARGEVAKNGGYRGNQFGRVAKDNAATAADIGLTRPQIHEARQIRDAEKRPGHR